MFKTLAKLENLRAFCAAIAFLTSALAERAVLGSEPGMERFVVDGLTLGGRVHTETAIYKQYGCSPSTQFRDYTYCKRTKTDNQSGSHASKITTILHASDGSVAYVNQFIDHATFSRQDIDTEVARLSTKYGETARVLESPSRPGFPQAVIAAWGPLKLVPLGEPDLGVLRNDKSPGKGILVDYLGDYTRSAQAGFPVYSIQGDFGYVWAANYDEQGRGTLRFFAINSSRLAAVSVTPDSQDNKATPPAVSIPPVDPSLQKQVQQADANLERQLEECGDSCPDKPELDKLRRDTIDQLEQANRATEDANRFLSASGNLDALNAYISSCDASSCGFRNLAITQRDALLSAQSDKTRADAEERQYRAARGDAKALKQYVSECNVCAFAQDAVTQISEEESKQAEQLFKLEVCSNEYLPVFVAFAGQPDLNSDMWTSEGWYEIGSGECKTIATLRKGDFFVTAHNKRAVWTGDDGYCTTDEAFTRILLPEGGDCLDGEHSTKFIKKHLDGSGEKFTWTLNAKPWSYTALAYSPSNSAWGWAADYPSAEQAKSAALELCSQNAWDCQIANWARDDVCIALASGPNDDGGISLGWATGDDARRSAYNSCISENGRSCRIAKISCPH